MARSTASCKSPGGEAACVVLTIVRTFPGTSLAITQGRLLVVVVVVVGSSINSPEFFSSAAKITKNRTPIPSFPHHGADRLFFCDLGRCTKAGARA